MQKHGCFLIKLQTVFFRQLIYTSKSFVSVISNCVTPAVFEFYVQEFTSRIGVSVVEESWTYIILSPVVADIIRVFFGIFFTVSKITVIKNVKVFFYALNVTLVTESLSKPSYKFRYKNFSQNHNT